MEINISLEFLQQRSLDEFIQEIKNKINREISISVIKSKIKTDFLDALNFLVEEQDIKRIEIITIYLLDNSGKNTAAYHLTSSKKQGLGSYSFKYVLDSSRFEGIMTNTLVANDFNTDLCKIWIHEIIHMLDHKANPKYLLENGVKSESNNLIAFLTELKLEGTAQLYEFLYKNNVDQNSSILFSALLISKKYISYTLEAKGDMNSNDLDLEISKFFTYNGSTWLILYAIMNSEKENESAYGFYIYNKIKENNKLSITGVEFKKLISYSMKMDLSEYIYRLCSINRPNLANMFDRELLLKELYENDINTVTKRSDYQPDFLKTVCEQNIKPSKFVDALRDIIGSCMSSEEIENAYEILMHRMKILQRTDYISKETILLTNELYTLYKSTKYKHQSVLAQWVLSYVLDDQDLICDETRQYGFIDDLLVLKSCIRSIYKMY